MEGMFARICIAEAAHSLEVAEIESEDMYGLVHWVWDWDFVADCIEQS